MITARRVSTALKPFANKTLEFLRLRTPRFGPGQNATFYSISSPPSVGEGARFSNGTIMENDYFSLANISGALFEPKYIKDSEFCFANISNSIFRNHTISHSNFYEAKVTYSWFENMVIENCNFSGCDLTGNNYENVTFKNCCFDGAYVYAKDKKSGRKIIVEEENALLNYLTNGCGVTYEATLF